MTVVVGDTATDLHAAEQRRFDDDDLAWQTLSDERLCQTVDCAQSHICNAQSVALQNAGVILRNVEDTVHCLLRFDLDWRFSIAVTHRSRSTQLCYIEPG